MPLWRNNGERITHNDGVKIGRDLFFDLYYWKMVICLKRVKHRGRAHCITHEFVSSLSGLSSEPAPVLILSSANTLKPIFTTVACTRTPVSVNISSAVSVSDTVSYPEGKEMWKSLAIHCISSSPSRTKIQYEFRTGATKSEQQPADKRQQKKGFVWVMLTEAVSREDL